MSTQQRAMDYFPFFQGMTFSAQLYPRWRSETIQAH